MDSQNTRQGWRLKYRLLLLTLIPSILLPTMVAVYYTHAQFKQLEGMLSKQSKAQAQELAYTAEYPVIMGYEQMLAQISHDLSLDPDVRAVAIFDKNQNMLASSGIFSPQANLSQADKTLTQHKVNGKLLTEMPIYMHGSAPENAGRLPIGWILLEADHSAIAMMRSGVLITCLAIIAIGVLLSCLLAIGVSRDVTRPLTDMVNTVNRIREGKLTTRVHADAKDEMNTLKTGINNMAEEIERSQETLQQTVDSATQELRYSLKKIEKQNRELTHARAEALKASQTKSEFLANMSHEIRTPMNGIIGFTELMLKSKLSALQKDYMTTIHKSAKSLLQILNDVLDFSKLEAGKLTYNPEATNLKEIIEDCLSILAPIAHEKQLELILLYDENAPEYVYVDPLRIKQVITNLISNAVKFTNHGHIVIRVALNDKQDNGNVLRVSVTDTGIGMDEDTQKRIFNAFMQGDTTTARRYGGTGLGLVISQKIVNQMSGSITLESSPKTGSTFAFSFFTRALSQSSNKTTPQLTPLYQKRAIVFEPHTLQLKSLHGALLRAHMEVTIAQNSDELQTELLKHEKYDIALISSSNLYDHPEIVSLTEQLAENPNILHVINLLNTSDTHQQSKLLKHGADLCLAKPVESKRLIQYITQTILQISPEYMPELLPKKSLSLRVLAVDDNPANLKLVTVLLQTIGCFVVGANSGKEAIAACEQEKFDLIFMDIHMPGMDGVETTKRIKALDVTIPVVALTAHATIDEHTDISVDDFQEFLTKPVSEHSLRKTINALSSNKKVVTMTEDKSLPVLDWSLAVKRANNNKDLALELHEMLLADLEQQRKDLEEAAGRNDFDTMRAITHKMKGACCYCGVPELHEAVKTLEVSVRENKADWEKLLTKLYDCIDRVLQTPIPSSN
jgi:two-component system sensor histidine kinase BarA